MQAKNLTVRNVFIGQYPNEDEDFVYRYPSNKNCYIEYYKYKNGVCIQIYRVHAPSEEDKLNCLKAFCNEMYGGGVSIN